MNAAKQKVRRHLPLTTAAKMIGMKFDTLMIAARAGELRIRDGKDKPGGFVQPMVTVKELRRFVAAKLVEYGRSKSTYLRPLILRLRAAKFPPETATLAETLRDRPAGWKRPRRGAASRA